MSDQSLKDHATHFSEFKGIIVGQTEHPTDSGPAGLQSGDMFYHTDDNELWIYDGSAWRGLALTSA